MNLLLILGLIFCAVAVNILWYRIKDILKRRGYKVHYLYDHLSDIYNLSDLIRNERDVNLKSKYKGMKNLWFFFVVLFLMFSIILIMRFEVLGLFKL